MSIFFSRNSVLVGHLNPDADSICSLFSIANFLKSKGILSKVFIPDFIPENLSWIIDKHREFVIHKIDFNLYRDFDFYVVDTDCSFSRTGVKFPQGINIINIDHHISRFEELGINDDYFSGKIKDKNNLEINLVLDKQVSTCSILATRFGINDPLLALGIYFDSVALTVDFNRSVKVISELNVDDFLFYEMINKTKTNATEEMWESIKRINLFWGDNYILAFDRSKKIDSSFIINLLCNFSKTIIYFHKNKSVSMRTSDNIDLSNVAKKYNGGGHKGSAAFKIKKSLKLESLIDDLGYKNKNNLKNYEEKLNQFFTNNSNRKSKGRKIYV